eukprot:13193-Heterococcus_DN1.PRE.2
MTAIKNQLYVQQIAVQQTNTTCAQSSVLSAYSSAVQQSAIAVVIKWLQQQPRASCNLYYIILSAVLC